MPMRSFAVSSPAEMIEEEMELLPGYARRATEFAIHDVLMPLTIRPTGLGAGIYQGRPDYSTWEARFRKYCAPRTGTPRLVVHYVPTLLG